MNYFSKKESKLQKRGTIVKRDAKIGKVSISAKPLDRRKTASDFFAEYEEKSHKRAMATMREILKSRNKDIKS